MKAGIVGGGNWGTKVTREYIALKEEKLITSVVLCDVDESKLKPFANQVQLSNSIDETIEHVDLLHICTPNSTHYEIAKKALNAGVNVLIEKPMAEKVGQAFELVELSLSKGLILQVGHIFRFANITRRIKQFVESGELGQIYYCNLCWTHLMPPMQNVDVIYDLLPHPLDILNWITGEWPVSFTGVGKACRRENLVEIANVDLMYPDFFASIYLSWLSPNKRRTLEIIGSKKSVIADCIKQTGQMFAESATENISVEPNNTIKEEILNMLNCIKTGKNDPNSSIVGARTIDMIGQIMKSIKTV
jgi:UDP-N-acetylglucosamine 3-dehydrogenase